MYKNIFPTGKESEKQCFWVGEKALSAEDTAAGLKMQAIINVCAGGYRFAKYTDIF